MKENAEIEAENDKMDSAISKLWEVMTELQNNIVEAQGMVNERRARRRKGAEGQGEERR